MKLPKLKKPTKSQVKKFILHSLIVIAGNALAASASAFFIMPHDLVMGGTTGLGIFMRNLLHGENEWIVSLTVYTVNILLFVIGVIFMGKKFAAATIVGTLLYPTFLSLFTLINEHYMKVNGAPLVADNHLLAAICAAILFGGGVGMVVRIGASTGGTDIPPLILHKFFNFPMSVTMYALDFSIVLIQLFVKSLDTVILGIFFTMLSAVTLNIVSPIGTKRTQVLIISKKYAELRNMILNEMNRGVTMLYGRTGFLQEKCYVLLTIVSNRDTVKLKNETEKIDPNAFFLFSVISEVRGGGFTSEKIVLPKSFELTDVTEEDMPLPAREAAPAADATPPKAE